MKTTTRLFLLAVGAVSIAVAPTPAAHATPCVNPDGSACPPDPPGCVNPDNQLPCSSSLPDVNAAIRRELQQILGGLAH